VKRALPTWRRSPRPPERARARFVVVACAVASFAACHARAADAPRTVTPSIDLEIEDRGSDKASHVARFSLSLADGRGSLNASDGDARYAIEAKALSTTEPRLVLKLDRHTHAGGDVAVDASIPQRAGPRVLIAKIDRADGSSTSIVAQVH
jgi:hypothetical protein